MVLAAVAGVTTAADIGTDSLIVTGTVEVTAQSWSVKSYWWSFLYKHVLMFSQRKTLLAAKTMIAVSNQVEIACS